MEQENLLVVFFFAYSLIKTGLFLSCSEEVGKRC